jgi:hypothetical protein
VLVGWADTTATVTSVNDSAGNTYSRAVGPATVSSTVSQSIYYAKNIISSGANVGIRTADRVLPECEEAA